MQTDNRLGVGLNPKLLEDFMAFIIERENIRIRKVDCRVDQPWTDDVIMQNHRFCNIFREDDTTTIWIRKNFREPYAGHQYLWFLICAARYINYIPSLARIGAEAFLNFDKKAIYQAEQHLRESGDKVFTSAYMITTGGQTGITLMQRVVEQILSELWENRAELTEHFENSTSLEHSCKELSKYTGFKASGGNHFMAYEVITDLRHTRYLSNATDIHSFCNVGPGATRAIHRLHSPTGSLDCVKFNRKQVWLNGEVSTILKWLKTRVGHIQSQLGFMPKNTLSGEEQGIPLDWSGELKDKALSKWDNLEMRDVEHSLCEFDKYLRIKTGEGRTRAKYVPNRGF